MSDSLSFLPWSHRVVEGPWDVGTEQRWRIEDEAGRQLVVGQLAADLAADLSIRRRYVRDTQRLTGLAAFALVPIEQCGPQPDPRDPAAAAPWRVRPDPPGRSFSEWLDRAPLHLDEWSRGFARLADAVASVHAQGAVLRDLQPGQVRWLDDGRVVLVDVGLSRVDVLSSHTASSLLMQGSAYAAPEQLHSTAVDQRADLYSVGVMMWRGLLGSLPFGDGPAFLRQRTALPSLTSLREDVPPHVGMVVSACLSEDPAQRPASAEQIAAILRGGAPTGLARLPDTICQRCAEPLTVGQRICLACGRVSVQFVSAAPGEPQFGVDLLSLREEAKGMRWLQDFIGDVAQPPVRRPEFLLGSATMHSEQERRDRISLPARLFGGLDRPSAEAIVERMRAQGLAAEVAHGGQVEHRRRTLVQFAIGHAVAAVIFAALQVWPVVGVVLASMLITSLALASRLNHRRHWVERTRPRFAVRSLPAALPASDPLVQRLAQRLDSDVAEDVRAVVSRLALVLQRVTDRRGEVRNDPAQFELLVAPLVPIVDAVETLVDQLCAIDGELAGLSEGPMVRALAASEARGEPPSARQPVLDGLDRLRALEDRRAELFHRLLEARSLLERSAELGLTVHDEAAEHERQISLALASLTEPT